MAVTGMPDWLASALGIGGGLGQTAGGLWGLFGNQKNPADVANQTIGKIPGQTQQYYSPYMQAGQGALSDLQNQNKGLLSGDIQNQLGQSYKESPGYQFKLKQAMQASNAANAAGGMLGTPAHEQQSMQLANDLASQDYADYLKNQIGLYNTGYAGEQGLNTQGYDASQSQANTIANMLGQQGAYSFAGQAGKNAGQSQAINNLFSGLGTTGASIFGGPAGASAWSALMNLFSGQGKGN
jgi:hypothetical protein